MKQVQAPKPSRQEQEEIREEPLLEEDDAPYAQGEEDEMDEEDEDDDDDDDE